VRKPGQEPSTNPLVSFPYSSLDSYLRKLVKAGYKVAVCDLLEEPKSNKKGRK
jgi:DNA mismatch repair protein MutS